MVSENGEIEYTIILTFTEIHTGKHYIVYKKRIDIMRENADIYASIYEQNINGVPTILLPINTPTELEMVRATLENLLD